MKISSPLLLVLLLCAACELDRPMKDQIAEGAQKAKKEAKDLSDKTKKMADDHKSNKSDQTTTRH